MAEKEPRDDKYRKDEPDSNRGANVPSREPGRQSNEPGRQGQSGTGSQNPGQTNPNPGRKPGQESEGE